jgi:hypothetical protein
MRLAAISVTTQAAAEENSFKTKGGWTPEATVKARQQAIVLVYVHFYLIIRTRTGFLTD